MKVHSSKFKLESKFKVLPCLLFVLCTLHFQAATLPLHETFSAAAAYTYTGRVAAFGERWPGSTGHRKTQDLIRQTLQKNGALIEADDFTATTPRGPIAVHNIIGKFNVSADPKQSIFILAGHYDTLFKPGFIGANDGGSSTGILLAFADALSRQKTKMQIWLVWTDLEEALESFVGDDGLYGSRHLAQRLAANGTAPRIKGFFLLDMIGDKDLGVARETTSKAWLQDYIGQAAKELGYSQYFFQYEASIIDDHAPFLRAGVPAVDVVDAKFGRMGPQFDAMGEFHHANTDTMDKVSQRSLEIVGRTILRAVELLDGAAS
jgi:Zn-dependent M28 family amino/carboxypeptidase